MRQAFSKVLPDVPILAAEATSIPVKDATFDAVFIAQAFHWFSNEGEQGHHNGHGQKQCTGPSHVLIGVLGGGILMLLAGVLTIDQTMPAVADALREIARVMEPGAPLFMLW
jgi:hypothetical protein